MIWTYGELQKPARSSSSGLCTWLDSYVLSAHISNFTTAHIYTCHEILAHHELLIRTSPICDAWEVRGHALRRAMAKTASWFWNESSLSLFLAFRKAIPTHGNSMDESGQLEVHVSDVAEKQGLRWCFPNVHG
ncbi:hypothetical protein VNO77_03489 [Canavalia gladiata]|uniref:Uncharacterized protein n=1 Tax=Canavalia gladiata TaxID=3824 RepID=A0AAN9R6V9_CANGL